MNYTEKEMKSNSEFYRVYMVYQSFDESKRFKRDLFNYAKGKEDAERLDKIKCPVLGRSGEETARVAKEDP